MVNSERIFSKNFDLILILIILLSLALYDLFFVGKFFGSFISYLIIAFFIFLFLSKKFTIRLHILKKETIYKTVLISLILLLFWRSSIFDFSGPLLMTDNPTYFYHSKTFLEALNEGYSKNNYFFDFGFAPYFFKTQEILPGLYSFIFNLDLIVSYRLFILLSFLIAVFGLYYLTKFKFGPSAAFFASLLFISFTHQQFIVGQEDMYLAVGISFFIFYFYERFRSAPLMLILFSTLIMAHIKIFMITLFVYLIIWLNDSKRSIKSIAVLLFPLLLDLESFVRQFFYYGDSTIKQNLLNLYMPYLWDLYDIFIEISLRNSYAVFILGLLGFISLKDKKWTAVILFLFLSICLSIFLPFPFAPHFSFYIRSLFCLFAGFFVSKCCTMKRNKLLVSLVLSIFVIDFLFYQIYLFQVWPNPNDPLFEYTNGGRLYDWEKLNLDKGIFAFQPNSHFADTIELINERIDKESRVLVEGSVYHEWGGYSLGLLGIYTDALFVTEINVPYNLEIMSAYDSIIFSRHIGEYTVDDFTDNLDIFNIKYIFAWTNEFKSFLNSNPEYFVFMKNTSDGFANMYEYINAPESFIYIQNGEGNITLGFNEIRVNLINTIAGEKMLLKFKWNDKWHAFLGDQELAIYKENSKGLIEIVLPHDGNYTVELRFL